MPEGWEWTSLGDISNYGECTNVAVSDIRPNDWVLELEDIEKDTANIIQHLSKNERTINGVRHYFQKGDVLYSKLRTYLNKVLVAPKNGYCTTEIIPFKTFGEVLPFYICHVLRSPYFLEYTAQCGYGVKMPRLSTTDACKGLIPLPPLAEQHRIVSKVEKWFSLIDKLEKDKVDLKAAVFHAKSKVLDLAIHGKLVSQDPDDEPAIDLLRRINPSVEPCDKGPYGKLPSGWTTCHITDVAESLLGKTLDRTKDIGEQKDYLCALNVQWDSFDLATIKQFKIESKDYERYSVKKGDMLICEGGDVGRAAIWSENREIYYQNALHRVRFKQDVSARYFLYALMCFKAKGTIDAMCKGVTIKHFTQSTMNKLQFPLPPYAEQLRIVSKIIELFWSLDKITESL